MKLLITFIIGLVLALLIGIFASHNEGYLVFSVADWTIQTSVNLFVVTIFIAFVVFYFLLRFFARLISASKDFRNYKDKKDKMRSAHLLGEGMTALIEGNWKKAESSLKKGATYSENPSLNYLAAARAAQQMGATERRDQYLKLAYGSSEITPVSVGLTQARLQFEQNQSEQALATLSNLHIENPQQPEVKRLLLKSYIDVNDWEGVIHLLPEIKKQKTLSSETINAYEHQAYAGLLENAGSINDPQKLGQVWLSIPKKMRSELYLIDVYVQQRSRNKDYQDSEILLRKALKKTWDERLVLLYGLVEGEDLSRQLAFAEGLLKQHARNTVLLLTLGRLCIKNKLWGKARAYFEECAEVQPSPELFYELAKLLHQLEEPQLASDYNQRGLELATQKDSNGEQKLLSAEQTILIGGQ